jgi:hypothetical protein
MRGRLFFGSLALSIVIAACGGSTGSTAPNGATGDDDGGSTTPPSGDDDGGSGGSSGGGNDSGGGADTGPVKPVDSGSPGNPGTDASYPSDPTDGPPTRQTCTGSFGSGLSAVHGRLDGTVVSIVAPGTPGGGHCNGDSSHLHLQMLMSGSVYDVAVNLDTYYLEKDMGMPTSDAYSEGWHTSDNLDYPSIGIHSSQFTHPASQSALTALLESALANANHLSVYATGYGPTGIHDVHRRSGGYDGAIVIDPLSATSHVFYFCFNTDNF